MSKTTPDIAAVAALIGEPARAAMLTALLDGRALPAGELARAGRVAPPTASAHLAKMLDGGLLAVERGGRNRYYRLANAHVARALEQLSVLTALPRPGSTSRLADPASPIRLARTCYHHLAGRLGVDLADVLVSRGDLRAGEDDYALTAQGERAFTAFGLCLPARRGTAALTTRRCLDWTERRPHVGGALGAALARRLLELDWLVRIDGSRALRVTARGSEGLRQAFGIRAS